METFEMLAQADGQLLGQLFTGNFLRFALGFGIGGVIGLLVGWSFKQPEWIANWRKDK